MFRRMDTVFFNSVAVAMELSGMQPIDPLTIRSQLADFMTDYAERYVDFVSAPEDNSADTSKPRSEDRAISLITDLELQRQLRWEAYISRLKDDGWADHVAVQATADMLNVSLSIVNTITPDWPHHVSPVSGPPTHTLDLGQVQQVHFVALKKTANQQNDECEAVNVVVVNVDNEPLSNEEQEEQQAFDETSRLRGVPYDTLLQEEDLGAQSSIYSVAPGESEKPMSFTADEQFEELSNPEKYPTGKGGFSTKRSRKLTLRRYYQQRILGHDSRFAGDVEYLLSAQYIVESKQVRDDAQIAVRQTRGQTLRGQTVNAGMVRCADNLRSLIRTDVAFRFLKNVRGSPAYWHTVLHDVLAMVRQLGIPTFFLTLSAADLQWPSVLKSIALQYGTELSDDDVSHMSWEQKCSWLRCNPVTAARMFQHRLNTFFKTFLYSNAHPIGEIQDHVIRIEFQARGSPHAHCVLWVKSAPKLGINTDEEVCVFINQHQTCAIPTDDDELCDLVLHRQKHSHSAACRKKTRCRFKFPHAPSADTIIAKPPEDEDNEVCKKKVTEALQVMKKVKDAIDEMVIEDVTVLNDILQKADVSMSQYREALSVNVNGKQIVLQRRPQEMNINYYNAHILKAWKANMDIQYIIDPYACIMYITSYMMKTERAMSELLQKTAKEVASEEIRVQLKKIGSVFLSNREVSAQEAAYRLLSLPLKLSSRKFVFVNTSPKDRRVSVLKPPILLENMTNDNEDLFCTSLLDRYGARPVQLEDLCLPQFAANYRTSYDGRDDADDAHPDSDDEDTDSTSHRINLQNGLGHMNKRKRPCVIRFHRIRENGEEKYRCLIMLYYPWRDEDTDLLGGYTSYSDHYMHVYQTIQCNQAKYSQNSDEIDRAYQDLQEYGPPEHAWDQVAPAAQSLQAEQLLQGVDEERYMDPDDVQENIDLDPASRRQPADVAAAYRTQSEPTMTQADYRQMMRGLNEQQRTAVTYHRRWCKDMIISLKSDKPTPVYRLFLSGPGGVGKSHVIKLIHHETLNLLKPLCGIFSPDEVPVILAAFTGTAAFNIEGMTLHSALSLPAGRTKKSEYQSLNSNPDRANTIRSKLSKLKLLIIDEISMVGADMLYHIHRRLDEITNRTNTDQYFGGVSILAVGDLYQLQPIGQDYVFGLPHDNYARLCGSLWQQEFEMLELTQSMRQKDDILFGKLLDRVRTASCTQTDIELLKTREIKPDDAVYPHEALHVFTTNNAVDVHNEQNLMKLTTRHFTAVAKDKKKDKQTGQLDVEIPTKPSETGGLRKKLVIAVGAIVMLTVNINVADGLSNGVSGTIVGIEADGQNVKVVLVRFDSPKVGITAIAQSQYRHQYPDAVPIVRHEAPFYIGHGRGTVQAVRQQFPLTLAWATTVHKVQGKTLDQIVVTMGKQTYRSGQAYVAFSRVRSIDGLYIIDFNPVSIRTNDAVRNEMARFANKTIPVTPPPCTSNLSGDDFIKISLLNVRSYKQHIPDMKLDTDLTSCNVRCFTETFLQPSHKLSEDELLTTGMVPFRRDRQHHTVNERGGILMCVHDVLSPEDRTSLCPSTVEAAAVQVRKRSETYVIVTVYVRPSSVSSVVASMTNLLQSLDNTLPTIILGDMNVNLLEDSGIRLLAAMSHHGYRQLVNCPTTDYGSILDHVYVNFQKQITVVINVSSWRVLCV